MKKTNISAEQSVGTSIVVSLSDIVLNLIVALFTHSTVMLSQAMQGVADLTTALLLLIGVKRSRRSADTRHPLGFGREVFFWSLLASIFALVVTGGFAIVKGLQQVVDPTNIELQFLALGMLLFGLLTNAYSMRISLHRLGLTLSAAGAKDTLRRIFHSSLVETKTTLLVDTMGTLSAIVGLVSISVFIITGEELFDGVGAILVGAITVAGAALLIYNLRDFIIGVSPRQEVIDDIKRMALSVEHVQDVLDLRALIVGSGKLFVVLEVQFDDDLTTDDIHQITDKIKQKLKTAIPTIHRVQVEVETPEQ